MSRLELVTEKDKTDQELRELKQTLKQAAINASTRGVYMNQVDFRNIELRIARLQKKSQRLQRQLGDVKKTIKTLPEIFMTTSEEMLTPDVFQRIKEIANMRLAHIMDSVDEKI